MSNSSSITIDPRLQAQLELFDWLIRQTNSDMMGALVRAWLIQQKNLIKSAGGTP